MKTECQHILLSVFIFIADFKLIKSNFLEENERYFSDREIRPIYKFSVNKDLKSYEQGIFLVKVVDNFNLISVKLRPFLVFHPARA